MSFNSKAYLAHEQRLLEPDSVIVRGNGKRYKPTNIASSWKHFDNLSPEEKKRWIENEKYIQDFKKRRDENI